MRDPKNRLMMIILGVDIGVTEKIKTWMVANMPTDEEYQKHLKEFDLGRADYISLLNEQINKLQAEQELKDLVKEFLKLRGKLPDPKVNEFFTVMFKLLLDQLVASHAKAVASQTHIFIN